MPTPTIPKRYTPDLNAKFVRSSSLQKSIRRGLTNFAIPAAEQLFDTQPQYLIRRLATVFLEDLGPPALPLAIAYMAEAVGRVNDTSPSTRQWVLDTIEAMCASPKSRCLTLISYTNHFHPRYQRAFTEYQLMGDSALLELLGTELDPLRLQLIARALSPSALKASVPTDVARLMVHARQLKAEGLEYALVPALREQPLPTIQHTLPTPAIIGGYPAYCWDRHTRWGSVALRQFLKLHMPELAETTPDEAWAAIFLIVFEVESSKLNIEVPYVFLGKVRPHYWETCLPQGWSLPDLLALLPIVASRLPLLDECRRKLITSDNHHSRS